MSHTCTVALTQSGDDTQLLQQTVAHNLTQLHIKQGHISCHNYSYKIIPAELDRHGYISTPAVTHKYLYPQEASGQHNDTHTRRTRSVSQTHT